MSTLQEIVINGIGAMEDTPNANLSNIFTNFLRQQGLNPEQLWKPLVDMVDNDDHIIMYIDIPGVIPDTLDVDFYNNKLKISGSREKPYNVEPLKKEIMYGNFTKEITLPISVTNKESVSVSAINGVLSIAIDKSNEERNRFSLRVSSRT